MDEKEQLIKDLIRENKNVTIKEYLQTLREIEMIMKTDKDRYQ